MAVRPMERGHNRKPVWRCGRALIVDVQLSGPPFFRAFIFAPVILALILLVTFFILTLQTELMLSGTVTGGLWIGITGVLGLVLFVAIRSDSRRQIDQLVHGAKPSELVNSFPRAYYRSFPGSPDYDLRSLARGVLESSGPGTVIRVTQSDCTSIAPFQCAFEAQPLDEGEAGFVGLEQSADARPKSDAEANGANRTDRLPPHQASTFNRLLRNVKLNGGWVIVLIVFLNLVVQLVASWNLGYLTTSTKVLIALVVVAFIGTENSIRISQRELFIVPGGLLVRRARRWSQRWEVTVFACSASVMVCREPPTRAAWRVAVATRDCAEVFPATEREVSLLLRAWTSPLEPPSIDRLGDLVG